MATELKLAFIIPTKGRYEELGHLLDSIENQSAKAGLVIIVDANTDFSEEKLKRYGFPIKYIHTGPNSLTQAKNIGIGNVPSEINLIGFLDDDVVFCKDAIRNMLSSCLNAPVEIGGFSFNILNDRKPRKFWFLKKIFLMGDNYPGNVLPSGYQTLLDDVEKDTYTKWLPGGASLWRREVFDKYRFDGDLKGYAYNEDMDFSYRVGKEYKLLIIANAKLMHKPHPILSGRENINFGISEIVNRLHFINKHREFLRPLFFWASFGKLLENITFGVFTLDASYFKRALGNIIGLKKIIFEK